MTTATIETGLRRALRSYKTSQNIVRPDVPAKPAARTEGLVVALAVRNRDIGMNELFVHETETISELEAHIEAERAARDAGWRLIPFRYGYYRSRQEAENAWNFN